LVRVSLRRWNVDTRFRRASARHFIVAFVTLCCLFAAAAVPSWASGRSSFIVHTNFLGPTDASRISLARADANRLMSLAWFPADARRLATWVHLKGFELSEPAGSIGDPDQIDIARFYLANPNSQGVSWLNARIPAGGSLDGEGGTDRANLEWSYDFPSTAILQQSYLQYTKRILPNGNVEFRIDAQVAWTPQKSRFSIIASGATLVQAVYSDSDQTNGVPNKRTASTTSNAMIATIRRQINALPVAYPGVMSCPLERPGSVTVRFFHAVHDRAFATVLFASSNCGEVQISQFSSTHHLLGRGEVGGGFDAVSSVLELLGLKNLL
jgi:hypothetical protein